MSADAEVRLRADGLWKSFRSRTVVNDVSLGLRTGEIVGLLGPNGAGKTTTFRMVAGLLQADKGRVLLGDRDLTGLPLHRRARLGLGFLPQEASIFRRLTVRENFLVALEGLPDEPMLGRAARRRREERADALVEEFHLGHVARARGETLSGGERRRVEIARSLIPGPRFMLFDEPFAGIDPIAVDDLQQHIVDLRRRGIGVLITDHSVRETLGICDRAYILCEGRILEEGTPEHLAGSERARAVYLGDRFRLG